MKNDDNPNATKVTTDKLEAAVRLILDACPHDGPRDEVMRERLLDLRDRLFAMQGECKYEDGRGRYIVNIVELIEWSLA